MSTFRQMAHAAHLVFRVAVVAVVLAIAAFGVAAKLSPEGRPHIFGRELLVVTSGSMRPALQPGDIVIVDTAAVRRSKFANGAIITFRRGGGGDMLVTHRVVSTAGAADAGALVTKGDANSQIDDLPVGVDEVVGQVTGRVPFIGRLVYGDSARRTLASLLVGLLLIEMGLRMISRRRQPTDEPTGTLQPA